MPTEAGAIPVRCPKCDRQLLGDTLECGKTSAATLRPRRLHVAVQPNLGDGGLCKIVRHLQ